MFTVKTVLKKGQAFIPIEEWTGRVDDSDYVGGALVLSLDGLILLDETLWDDINWLWPYIADGLPDLLDGKDWKTGFPDQPVTFSVGHVDKEWIRLHVFSDGHDFVRKKIRKRAYLTEMTRAGIDFFTRFDAIAPKDYSAAVYLPLLNSIADQLQNAGVRVRAAPAAAGSPPKRGRPK
ncbi:hypothetical protein HF313_06380 [Massilia atriviolacea]|uniref:Uncharacterized protein n=1 Tax=Massilia atriviolacea TaxID=2495579 RepID=A0A430HCR5_9BURK|nr:hypothetical protein [Massilia atriviolacea]RSZ55312.1 hypothetical protein EJB06_30005 [Massilia atriviolacea]